MTRYACSMRWSRGRIRLAWKRMGWGELVAAASSPDGFPCATCSASCVSANRSSADALCWQASRTARMIAPAAAAEEPRPRSWGKSLRVVISKDCPGHPENSRAASKALATQANREPTWSMGPRWSRLSSHEGPGTGVAVACIGRSCSGTATAGCPYTTECSPRRMAFAQVCPRPTRAGECLSKFSFLACDPGARETARESRCVAPRC